VPNPSQLTHESSGEGLVGSDLSVDLDETLLDNGGDLTAGKGVLQSVTKEDGEGKALSELVRTGRWARGLVVRNFPQFPFSSTHVGAAELVEHP